MHVVGLYVQQPPVVPRLSEGGTRQLHQVQRQLNAEAAAQAGARFDEGVRAAAIARAEWRVDEVPLAETMALHARYGDLLVVPYVGKFPTLADNLRVAWNASRDAARTVAAEVSVGDEILSRPFDCGGDVIVIGTYGHSRARVHPGRRRALDLAQHDGAGAAVARAAPAGRGLATPGRRQERKGQSIRRIPAGSAR